MIHAHLKKWLLSLLVCSYDKRLCTIEHKVTPAQLFCVTVPKHEHKAKHQEEADVVLLQRFYIFLQEAECSDRNKQKAFFFKSKSAAPIGKQYKKKKLDFQAAKRQKPSNSYSLYLNFQQ